MSNVRNSPTSARKPAGSFNKAGVARQFLKRVVDARDVEVGPLLQGFSSLFCVLASYFVLLPIRDEVGVSLGTEVLPTLFCLSLVVTLIATPLASEFLLRPNVPREKGLRQLFTFLAGSFIVFFLAYALLAPLTPDAAEGSTEHGGEKGQLEVARRLLFGEDQATAADSQHLTRTQVLVRAAFFLWLTVVNLVALSTVWARIADVFGGGASKRLFGFLGAGATCGQLAGSLLATLFARLLKAGAWTAAPGAAHLQACPMLVSALLLEAAGHSVASLRPLHAGSTARMPSSTQPKGRKPGSLKVRLWKGVSRLWDGFRCIRASHYLSRLTVYIILTTTISSMMYFMKSMVVASAAADSASRMAIFATINSASAFVIAGLQLFTTGFLLTRLKLPAALGASAAFAAGLMAVIAVHPSPAVVGGGEVIRKVINYVLTRPAREALYTVVEPEEIYKAKMCIDTVIVRLGDTVAAGLFQVLEGFLHAGPSKCAIAAIPVCLACAGVAYSLGLQHEQLAAN